MSLTFEAVLKGHKDEAEVAYRLHVLGWGVVPFGQGMWDPKTCPEYGDASVIEAVRAHPGALDHAPDLLAGRGAQARLVEVVNCGTWERRALELAKMVDLHDWARIAPVWLVDVSDWRAWIHRPGWPEAALSDVTREGRGSGDPWCLYTRRNGLPFGEAFA